MTFQDWMKENLLEYVEDITEHGADAGYPHITYYTDTVKLYDQFHEEIWEALYEDAEGLGCANIFELIASFGRAEASSDQQFKNLLVWYMVERTARDMETLEETWGNWTTSERVEYCQEYGVSVFAARCDELPV